MAFADHELIQPESTTGNRSKGGFSSQPSEFLLPKECLPKIHFPKLDLAWLEELSVTLPLIYPF